MPTVPRYERQVETRALPGVRVNDSAPIEAFGGGASTAAVGQAASGLAGKVQEHQVMAQRQANEIAFTEADVKAQSLANDLQIQSSQMLGKDALGAPDITAKGWKEGTDKIRESLTNDAQKAAFDRSMQRHWMGLDKSLKIHTATQFNDFADKTTVAGVDLSRSAAVINSNDDQRVEQEIMRQVALKKDQLKRKGIPELNADGSENPIYKDHLMETLSKTHSAVLGARIDHGFDKEAQGYFVRNKGQMTPEESMAIDKRLQAGKDITENLAVYNEVRMYKLPDGRTPDEAKMEKDIMARKDISDQKKLKMVQFVKAKAGSDHTNMIQRDRATDESYKNEIVQLKKEGATLEDALKKAPSFAYNDYDQSLKEDFARKLWAGKGIKSDPATLVALHDAIDEGKATKEQIDFAFKNDMIDPQDWVSTRDRWHNVEIEGKSPEAKRANESVKQLAKERFGSDKDGMAAFILEVDSAARGKSADEKIKIANDKLKDDESTAVRVWDWVPVINGMAIPGFGEPQFETDQKKRTANSLTIGKFHQDLGVDTVKAIEQGAIRSNKPAAESVNDLSIAFGGYDKIKPGTPAHNAIQSLTRHGRTVTAESIKFALQNKPDGKF